jgi:hypothetical protein
MTENLLTCAEFEALIPDWMDGTLSPRDRERMDAHRLDCAECEALVADLADIRTQAANLGTLTPSRDLWSGVESRIQADVIEFPITPIPGQVTAITTASRELAVSSSQYPVGLKARRVWVVAAAASMLVASTAVVTWDIATRNTQPAPLTTGTLSTSGSQLVVPVRGIPMEESYDKEIADLRRIVDEHSADIDSATVAVLERSLKVIDAAIAESKAALIASPDNAFLAERLNDAYATKLRTLRAVVTPRRG